MAAHQAPPSLGFSRQEHWSGLPFPSPVHESEKWKQSHSVVSDSELPHGLQPTRLLRPWDFSRQECWCRVPMPSPSETLDMIKNNCQNRKHQHVEGQQDERGRELDSEGFLEEWSPGVGWQCRALGAGDTTCQGTHPEHQKATCTRNSWAPRHTLEQAPPCVCSWGLTALPPACSPNF